MDTKHANPRAREAVLTGLLIALAGVFCPPQAAAQKGKEAQPLKQDEACLACHGQPGMKSDAGKNISVDPAKHAASAHGVLGCRDCHTAIKDFPHPARIAKVQCAACHAAAAADVPASVHAALGEAPCQSCHGNVHELVAADRVAPAKCTECHESEVKEFQQSVHGQAAKAGDPDAPTCFSCHGAVHKIRAANDAAAMVAKKNLANTCAACHSDREFLARHKIPFAHPVELYEKSVHGRAVAVGKQAAICSDCHGSHGILAARNPRSKINHWNVVSTCAQCHSEIAKTYLESIHGQAMKAGVRDTPVCTDCHGEHLILGPREEKSTVSAARVSTVTCGRCHGDERLALRYNLPTDRLPSYAESFHGLAMREGSQTVANCASCHGVHDIFPSSDSRSTVHAANLPKTCGHCHAGAGEKFAIGPVHVQMSRVTAHPVVKWIRGIYLVLIPATIGFMLLHNLIDFVSKLVRRRRAEARGDLVMRMNLYRRIAHWGVIVSFGTLVYTGFALKFPDAWWARPLMFWEERFALRRDLHRIAAVVLLLSTIYHLIYLAWNRRDRTFLKDMFPRGRDVREFAQVILFNLGLSDQEPTFTRFNYAQKLEYWAFLWGTLVMGASGFLLWFNNFTLRHFPKWTTDAATAVHWYEALLATFSILVWHFYMVIYDPVVYPMDFAWLTGTVPARHYRHTRPEYLRLVEKAREEADASGPAPPDVAPGTKNRPDS